MMKFRTKTTLEIKKGYLDIAPLINILFLLLIFFMLTSSFILQPGIRVNLPKAVTGEVLSRNLFIISVDEKGDVYINERRTERDILLSRIALATKDCQPILINADKKADFGKIIEIWDMCRREGVKQINVATAQE
ncbi:MAG: biopolymer transporter ExbD [Candidatus Omnitrophica bacterium]|nr:biopolymer transporter ExbD [Candidatus Omnitrophota bacterium]